MANLGLNIELTSTVDTNRTLVSNIGRAIMKKLAVKFEENEIMSGDDFDVFACHHDLWKTKSEKRNAIRQGIISANGCMENCIKLRINAGDKSTSNIQDKAIADVYRNKFIIPLDFEMLDSAAPYYQAGLGNRLCYELTFNDYNRVTKSGVSSPKVPDAKYMITDISLEYEIWFCLRKSDHTHKTRASLTILNSKSLCHCGGQAKSAICSRNEIF